MASALAHPVARIAVAVTLTIARVAAAAEIGRRLQRRHAFEATQQLLFGHDINLGVAGRIVAAKLRHAAVGWQQRRCNGFRLIDFGVFLE